MKLNYYHLLLCCFILLIAVPSQAQQYHYKTYSVEEGLPQSEIWSNCMIQDERGSIWVGTNGGGVVRFDGDNKTIYSKKDGLPSNTIRSISQDQQKNIWIVTMSGVAKFDGYTFTNYLDTGNQLANINNIASAPQIFEDAYSNIWLHTQGAIFLLQDTAFVNYTTALPKLNGAIFNTAFLDKDNKLWVTTATRGVWIFNNQKFEPAPIIHAELSEGKNLAFAYYDKDYNTWYIAVDPVARTAQLLMNDGSLWIDFKLPPGYNPGFTTDVMVDRNEHIWIANGQLGVLKYDGERFWRFNRPNGMSNDAVTGLLEDYEGNVWASTRGGGLVKIPSAGFTNFSSGDGLPHPIIFSVYEDSKQNIWLGTTSNGFCKYDGKKIINFPQVNMSRLGRIDGFFEEPSGDILVLSRFLGALRFNGKTCTPVNKEFGLPTAVNGGAGVVTLLDGGDHYLFGMWGTGVFIWDKKTQKIVKNLNAGNGLQSSLIQDIKQDSKGNYWISNIAGVDKFDGETVTPIITTNKEALGVCLHSHIDEHDNVWVVSYDRGLYRITDDKATFFDLMTGENSTNLFYSILEDEKGALWIGTQQGIDKLDINEQFGIEGVTRFRSADGLSGVEMNGRAALRDSKDNLWFGHLKGASYYTPSEKVFNETPPVSSITDLDLFLEDVDWSDKSLSSYHNGVNKWYNLPQDLALPYDQNHLTFHFASMSYTLPEKVKRQWMLSPLNADWLPATRKKEATFSSLAPDSYVFKVRTQNNDGVWGNPVEFAFEITPPFWMTWWFWLLSAIIVIGTVVVSVRMRIKALKENKAELERLVKVRTVELVNRNEEITMQNAALEQQKEEILTQAEEIEDQNKALATANDSIVEQHKNITSSITYAKRIQEAMLPRISKIKESLPESFILYKPRDIVSGDFYWFDERTDKQGNQKTIIAVADCTGHGVPGAFMSMTGDAYLNLIVRSQQILAPNQVLDELNNNISKALKQGITENRDGMDIAFCVIDKVAQNIEFAAARNPLIYIHDGELKQLKGDRHSIGGTLNGPHFKKQVLHYEPDTVFYMFSDGYVDQFGGPDNRKYLIRNFRETLLEIHQLPLTEQKQILTDKLNKWKGDSKQVDDILVIGFRL